MNSKAAKANVDLHARRSPAAPAAYRPQPVPRVLQRKTSQTSPLTQGTTWSARTVQLAEAPPQPPPQPPPPPPPGPPPQAPAAAAAAGGKRKIGGLSDAEALKRRNSKFAKDNEAAEAERNQKQQQIAALRKAVNNFDKDVRNQRVQFFCHPGAKKHGYADPVETFQREFARANYSNLQARQGPHGLEITVRMGGIMTVSGSYQNGEFTVVHCGEVQGGMGYGTPLGD